MAIWGAGAILGPILGPVLGGYLTQDFSWRWCFFVNLPIGILAFLGVLFFISSDKDIRAKKFDFLGFGMLSLFVAAFQIVLDRGPSQDWFNSREIWTETILAIIGLWVFVVHTMTTRNPFFDPGLIRDRNFVTASIFGFFVGILLFASLALLPPMMQTLLDYPVLTSGLVTMPRGIGSLIAMFAVGQLIGRVDTRLILLFGLSLGGIAFWQMTHFDLSMTAKPLVISGLIQGLGIGLLFVPLSALAFATLPARLRSEGSSVYTLIRNLGASVGISIMNALLVFNTQTMHGSLAAKIIPSDAVLRSDLPPMFDPSTVGGLTALNAEVTRQASMVAYIDDFKLMLIITLVCIPMLLFLRKPRRAANAEPLHAAVD
jgi:DHA2 family multidrug resistance protein